MDHKLSFDANGVPTIEDMMSGYTVTGTRACIQYLVDSINRCNELYDECAKDPDMLKTNENYMWCYARMLRNLLACHED